MRKLLVTAATAAAAIAILPTVALADTMKGAPAKGKMVVMYKAAKCGMIFTPAQASKYHFACPISHGKMTKVMLSPTAAKAADMKTMSALAPKKTM